MPTLEEESIADALNKQLLDKTLLEEKTHIESMKKVVEAYDNFLKDSFEMRGYSKEELYGIFLRSMKARTSVFLKTIFEANPVPKVDLNSEQELPSFIRELVEEWFDNMRDCTADLQIIAQGRSNPHKAKECMKERWDIMLSRETDLEAREIELIISSAIDNAEISTRYFPVTRLTDAIKKFLLNPLASVDNPIAIQFGGAITLETFWWKYSESYSKYYTNMCGQFLEAFEKSRNQSETGR